MGEVDKKEESALAAVNYMGLPRSRVGNVQKIGLFRTYSDGGKPVGSHRRGN